MQNPNRFHYRLLIFLVGVLTPMAVSSWASAPAAKSVKVEPTRPRIDVAFVVDTTGSMGGLLEGAKQKIWSIADAIASADVEPEIRMGLIAYRDRGDAYVTRRHELTSDIDQVYAHLRALEAGGGGDGPESVNQALNEAVTRLAWDDDPKVYRVVFLVGDAPPHMDYDQDVTYRETVRAAAQRDIVINAVQCGGDAMTQTVWREIAKLSAGTYASIAADGGMVATTTPMDARLAELQLELSKTAIPYGSAKDQDDLESKLHASVAAAPAANAARLSYLNKKGGRLVSGRGDLVDAVIAEEVDVSSIPEKELPLALAALPAKERDEAIKEKVERRNQINTEIAQVVEARDAYVRTEQKKLRDSGAASGFDVEVLDAIRKQAGKKGIAYTTK